MQLAGSRTTKREHDERHEPRRLIGGSQHSLRTLTISRAWKHLRSTPNQPTVFEQVQDETSRSVETRVWERALDILVDGPIQNFTLHKQFNRSGAMQPAPSRDPVDYSPTTSSFLSAASSAITSGPVRRNLFSTHLSRRPASGAQPPQLDGPHDQQTSQPPTQQSTCQQSATSTKSPTLGIDPFALALSTTLSPLSRRHA